MSAQALAGLRGAEAREALQGLQAAAKVGHTQGPHNSLCSLVRARPAPQARFRSGFGRVLRSACREGLPALGGVWRRLGWGVRRREGRCRGCRPRPRWHTRSSLCGLARVQAASATPLQ